MSRNMGMDSQRTPGGAGITKKVPNGGGVSATAILGKVVLATIA